MTIKAIPYADAKAMQTARAAIDAAKPALALTDASGRPADAQHPLLARNPAFALSNVRAVELDKGAVLFVDDTDAAALAALGADAAKAVAEPAKPTTDAASVQGYLSALKALVPADVKAAVETVPVVKVK